MSLHVPTLVLMLVVGFGLLTLQLWVAGRGALNRGELRQLAWSSGPFCGGFLFFALRPWLPGWLTLVGGNLLLMVGIAGLTAAVYRHLLNRSLPVWHHWLFVAAALAVPAVLDVPTPVRAGGMSAAMGLLMLPGTIVALRQGWRGELSFRVVALMLLLASLALWVRVGFAAWWLQAKPDADMAAFWSGAIFMLAFMAVLAAGFSFVLASFERVASQMRQLASIDGLTGACNHNTTVSLLAHSLERSRREGQPVSFVMLDLDHFKRVNDRHGHAVGDLVLQDFARRACGLIRRQDVFGRLGGEEFLLILPETTLEQAALAAERLRLAQGRAGNGLPVVTLSAGVVSVPHADWGFCSAAELLVSAGHLLQVAKDTGDRVVSLTTVHRDAAPAHAVRHRHGHQYAETVPPASTC